MAENEDATSRPDEAGEVRRSPKRSRPPVTIDLAASVVGPNADTAAEARHGDAAAGETAQERPPGAPEPERSAPPPGAAPASVAPPRAASSGNWVGLFAAGLVGALIALLFGYGLLASGVAPGGDDERLVALASKDDGLASAIAETQSRLAALETKAGAPNLEAARLNTLAARLDALVADSKTLGVRIGVLEGDVAQLPAPGETQNPASTSELLDDLVARIDRLESEAGEGIPQAIGDRLSTLETRTALLSGRLDALSNRMTEQPAAAAESERATKAVAIATLRQGSASSGGFAAELAMIAALAPNAPELATLRPLADKGAPSLSDIAAAFPVTVQAILKASAAPGASGGVADRLMSHLRGLVTIRPVGPIAGSSPEAVVSRMQAAVERGDLATALRERDGLDEAGKAASATWAKEATDRVAIDDLVGKLVAAVGAPPPEPPPAGQ
jgi:hypothetical protein